jgi:hypothetical protein
MDGVILTHELARRLIKMLTDYERGAKDKADDFLPVGRNYVRLANSTTDEIPPYGIVQVIEKLNFDTLLVGQYDGSPRANLVFWFNGPAAIAGNGGGSDAAVGMGQYGPIFRAVPFTGTRLKPKANSFELEEDDLGEYVAIGSDNAVMLSPLALRDIRWNEDDLTLEKTFDGDTWDVVVAGSECPE